MYRKTYVKIDNKKLTRNIEEIKNKYKDYKYYIGVVKGNAYGHGFYIVNDLIKGGVNYLAVSSIDEALEVRKYNKDIPILILEPTSLEYLDVIIDNKLTITVDRIDYIRDLIKKDNSKMVKIHLKVDSGMNRLGFKDRCELEESIKLIKSNNLILEGIYTHIGTSGINDIYYDKSISRFRDMTKNINLLDIPIVHINRSITLVHHEKLEFETGVRLGIIMYGFSQSIREPKGLRKIKRDLMVKRLNISPVILENDLKLETAFSLYSEVISIRKVSKGEYVGYGANYIAKEDIDVITIPIGYYDGITKNNKYVFIRGKRYEIIGDICMDMIQVKGDSSIKINDKVEIMGDNITIKEVIMNSKDNAYHLLTGITTRVVRVYDNNVEIKY